MVELDPETGQIQVIRLIGNPDKMVGLEVAAILRAPQLPREKLSGLRPTLRDRARVGRASGEEGVSA